MNQTSLRFPNSGATPLAFAFFLLVAACAPDGADAGDSGLPVIRVEAGQTLNAALEGTDGPVHVLLPEGVTEHDAPITRNATVILEGRGRDATTLRPAAGLGPDEGLALVEQTEGYDGDFILKGLTYDRAFQPGTTPGDPEVATGATIFQVSAQRRVLFRDVAIHRFDYGARVGEKNADAPFVFTEIVKRNKHEGVYRHHTEEIAFENVTVDFKKDGGIRHRPGRQHHSFRFGTVDRLRFDADVEIIGHLCQSANPGHTVGEVWRGRGNSGPMYGISAWIYERAEIDGVWRYADYAAWRGGGVATPDAVIEWRMDLPDCGYADAFWMSPGGYGSPEPDLKRPAGHLIFRDVKLIGNHTGELWNDYGLKVHEGAWKSVLVENCQILKRGHPLAFLGAKVLGDVTIRDSEFASRSGGGPGIMITSHYDRIGRITIENVHIHGDPWSENPYYSDGIHFGRIAAGGPIEIRNVRIEDYLQEAIADDTGPDVAVTVKGLQSTPTEFSLPEGFDFAVMWERKAPNPRRPRPDYRFGPERPGIFAGKNAFSPAWGESDADWREIVFTFNRESFGVFASARRDAIAPLQAGNFASADRFRFGIALGRPGNVDTWHVVEIAAAEGDPGDPTSQARARLLRYPGGETVATGAVEAGRVKNKNGIERWAWRVPWEAVGIDPNDETFFVNRSLALDLAYIDVDKGETSGAFQFLGKSGLLPEVGADRVRNFKRAYLRGVDWDDVENADPD